MRRRAWEENLADSSRCIRKEDVWQHKEARLCADYCINSGNADVLEEVQKITAVASSAIDVKGIVTHTFDLDHIQEAYQEAVNNKTDLVKAVVRIQQGV